MAQGTTVVTHVNVTRHGDFTGPIDVTLDGLPSGAMGGDNYGSVYGLFVLPDGRILAAGGREVRGRLGAVSEVDEAYSSECE